MSQQSPNTIVQNVLASIGQEFDNATANQGFGMMGEWPSEGEHDCYLIGMAIEPSKLKLSSGQELDAANISFKYRLIQDPEHATPLEWNGARFQIPRGGASAVTDSKRQTVVRMEIERLRGHLQCILNRAVTGAELPAALASVQQLLSSQSSLISLQVMCQYRVVPPKTYRTEYVQKNLSTAAPTAA